MAYIDPDAVIRADNYINISERDADPTNDEGRVVKLEADGRMLAAFLNIGIFGDGADGDLDLDGTNTYATIMSKSGSDYTLIRDVYANNLEIPSGSTLITNGYRVYVKNTILGAGTIKYPDGNSGTSGVTNATTKGVGGAALSTPGYFGNNAGGDGGVGDSNSTGGQNNAVSALPGVNGNIGGDAGQTNSSGQNKAGEIVPASIFNALLGLTSVAKTLATYICASGGGGNPNGNAAAGITSTGGGGGGASGGVIWIAARFWTGTFTIRAVGGNGGNGGDNTSTGDNSGYGGDGGAGGCAIVVYEKKTWTGTATLTGGTGGNAGSAVSPYVASQDGQDGDDGTLYEINLASL